MYILTKPVLLKMIAALQELSEMYLISGGPLELDANDVGEFLEYTEVTDGSDIGSAHEVARLKHWLEATHSSDQVGPQSAPAKAEA